MSDPQGNPTPPQYAAYPRGQATYGTADKLQALADGYFGLNWAFLINVVLLLLVQVLVGVVTEPATAVTLFAGGILLVGLAVGFATFPHNKKIGYGANWSPSGPFLASLLMAINSALFCGIIGYIVVQSLALKEMKKYGVTGGTFGLRKKHVQAFIRRMGEQPPMQATIDVSPPPTF